MSADNSALSARAAPRRLYVVAAILILALPWLPVGGFTVNLAQTFSYTAIAVIGLNILLGLSGQISLGQAGFYALGAYASALTALKLGWPVPISVVFGTGVAGVFGALVGVFALRTRGLYLAMTTLAVGFIIDILVQRWVDLTGGTMGLMGVPQIEYGDTLRGGMAYLYFAGFCLLFVQIGADYIHDSRIGRALRALRESEVFATSVGIHVARWRALTFAGSAALAGLGGALFAHQSGFVGSDAFSVRLSISMLIAAVIGGLGTKMGPLIGTLILLAIVELIAGLEKFGLIVYGAILLGVLIAFPRGAAGLLTACWRLLPRARGAQETSHSDEARELPSSIRLDGCELTIENVTKRYFGVVAADDVTISVKKGTIHGLIGPNGAGKSTIINVIAGIYRADAGRILLGRQNISGLPTSDRARLGLARTFQNLQLIEAIPAIDNVLLGFSKSDAITRDFLHWWSGKKFEDDQRREAFQIMAFLGIAAVANRLPSELSYGHRKLLELARAIAQRPRAMLLDEPIAGLNGKEAREIAIAVRRLRELGVTILLVEHNMEFVMSLCDAISVLDHGQLIATGTPAEIQCDKRVVSAYLGVDEAA